MLLLTMKSTHLHCLAARLTRLLSLKDVRMCLEHGLQSRL